MSCPRTQHSASCAAILLVVTNTIITSIHYNVCRGSGEIEIYFNMSDLKSICWRCIGELV